MIQPRLCWRAPFLWAIFALTPTAILTLGAPSIAVADDQAQARERFLEGRSAYEEGDYIEAASKFLEAYELSGRSELLYNVGQAYRRADALQRAELYFQEYLNQLPDAPNADEVVETIIEIQRTKAARMATFSIISDPPGATLSLLGEDSPRCTAPCELDLDPGTYELRAHLDGHQPYSRQLDVQERQREELTLNLVKDIPTAQLHARADVSGATLIINQRAYSIPTTNPIELEAGSHEATIEYNGRSWQQQIELIPGEILHIYVPTGAAGGGFSPLQISGVALGGASIALATAALLAGNQARSSYQALELQHSELGAVDKDLLNLGKSQQFLTNGLWLGAIVTLGAGAGLWTWDWLATKKSAAPLEPTPEIEPEQAPPQDMPGIDLL